MFSTEIRINGNLVGYVYGRRLEGTEHALPEGTTVAHYEYEYYEPDRDGNVRRGKIVHVLEDGIAALVSSILLLVSNEQQQEKKAALAKMEKELGMKKSPAWRGKK